ncbi:hypothetical protein J2Z47_001937 [Cohnella thailandensis]|nr:hypothetical protein [Cohnella thailandensis]
MRFLSEGERRNKQKKEDVSLRASREKALREWD